MITIDLTTEIPWMNPAKMIAGLRNWIHKSILVLEWVAKENTPVNSWFLRNSFRSRFDNLEWELVNTALYAQFVHDWRRAWKMPPISQIEYWAKRKWINIPAFVIAQSIARRWTKAQPFFARAVEQEEQNVIGLIKYEIQKSLW